MKTVVLSVLLLSLSAGAAQAYTAFMKPNNFYPTDERATVQAAYTTQFFTPGVGINSPGFQIVDPAGHSSAFTNMAVSAQDSVLEAALLDRGTYRLSTGELYGGITNLVGNGAGGWRPLAAGEAVPEGEQTTTLQTVTVAEAYVTQGAVNRTAVDMNIGRLAIHPVTHPNQILASSGFQVTLLLDGQPLPNAAIVLYAAGDAESKLDRYATTDAQGQATFTFDQPGVYTIAARYRGPAPADAGVAIRSYTTTLTFEALSAIPAATPEPRDRNNRRRNNSRLF